MAPIKIQLSPKRIAKDHATVWQDAGSEVDMTMDLKNLTFRPNSLDSIIAFHVLDHLFESEVPQALKNWHSCLMPGGTLICLVDDFEYIARAIVGADISMEIFNREHSHAMQFSHVSLLKFLRESGFNDSEAVVWYQSIPDLVPKQNYEILLAVRK